MKKMIKRLKMAGVRFEQGMTGSELDRAEECFGFRFPREIRSFLTMAMPVGKDFFDFRDRSDANRKHFEEFQSRIENGFRFDLEHNREMLLELLGEKLGFDRAVPGFDDAVLRYWRQSVRLIPFYAHRCFFDGMDDMPIVSFLQPVDTIVYGNDLERYLEAEFLGAEELDGVPREKLKLTGIWNELIW